MPTALPGAWLPTWHFRMPARCCRRLVRSSLFSVLGTEASAMRLLAVPARPSMQWACIRELGVSGQGTALIRDVTRNTDLPPEESRTAVALEAYCVEMICPLTSVTANTGAERVGKDAGQGIPVPNQ